MRFAKERLIILRAIKYSEADLIIHAINENGGRVNLIAKSALKSRKRFGGGVLEPTHFIEASYRVRDNSADELHILEEARLLEGFSSLRGSYERLELALYFLQVIDKVTAIGVVDDPELFLLLGKGLRATEKRTDFTWLRQQFEARLLRLQGELAPELATPELVDLPL